MHRLPVAACRRAKMAAIRGAAWVNSGQVVTVMTLRRVQPTAIIAVRGGQRSRRWSSGCRVPVRAGNAGAHPPNCACRRVGDGNRTREIISEDGRYGCPGCPPRSARQVRQPRAGLDETQQRAPTATGWPSSASRRVGQTKTRSGAWSTWSTRSPAATSRLTGFGATGRRSGRREARRRERSTQVSPLFCVTLAAEGRRMLEKTVSTAPEVMSAIAALDAGTRRRPGE